MVPEKRAGRLVIAEPVTVSRNSVGVSSHSGVPSALVSRGPRIHIVWAEATDPKEKVPGVPTYVVTYERKQKRFLGKPVLFGYGAPPKDIHNRPSFSWTAAATCRCWRACTGSPFATPNPCHLTAHTADGRKPFCSVRGFGRIISDLSAGPTTLCT